MITISGLRQGYRGRTVLDDLHLTVERGVTGVLGPNGAGKTTLLRTLATVTPAQAGRVTVAGRDVGTPAAPGPRDGRSASCHRTSAICRASQSGSSSATAPGCGGHPAARSRA